MSTPKETAAAHMKDIGAALDKVLNPGLTGEERKVGFALIVYEFGQAPTNGRVNYVGNGKRNDVRAALAELLARWEGRYAEPTTEQKQ